MSNGSHINPGQEYESLRNELAQSKKYVFERPLVIVGIGLVLVAGGHASSAIWVALLAGLLLLNFWFTVNRLRSAARITAYIQIVLEGDALWEGWENSLRKYRKWMQATPDIEQIIESELADSDETIPEALTYYRPIHQLHIALVIVATIAGGLIAVISPNAMNVIAGLALIAIAAGFAWLAWTSKPSEMRTLIEREGIIWAHALKLKSTGRWRRQSGRFSTKVSTQRREGFLAPSVIVNIIAASLSVLMAISIFMYVSRSASVSSDLGGEMVYGKLADGTFYIVAPVAYRNSGAKPGTLTGFYLDITEYDVETDTEGRTYRLCPDYYQELNSEGHWDYKSNISSIPIEAGQSGVEFVRFTARQGRGPELSHTFVARLFYSTTYRNRFKQAHEHYVILNNVPKMQTADGSGRSETKYEVLSSTPSVYPDLSRSRERGYLQTDPNKN